MLRIRIRKIRRFLGLPDLQSASGSVSHKHGSGSGSFLHQAKIVKKTLISTILWLIYDFSSLKNDVNVPVFWIRIWIRIRIFLSIPGPYGSAVRILASGSVPKCHGSATLVPSRHTCIFYHCAHMPNCIKKKRGRWLLPHCILAYLHTFAQWLSVITSAYILYICIILSVQVHMMIVSAWTVCTTWKLLIACLSRLFVQLPIPGVMNAADYYGLDELKCACSGFIQVNNFNLSTSSIVIFLWRRVEC
jgi:ssDNA-binding Zn-finger/Zn-ribbon topoisomerase 1